MVRQEFFFASLGRVDFQNAKPRLPSILTVITNFQPQNNIYESKQTNQALETVSLPKDYDSETALYQNQDCKMHITSKTMNFAFTTQPNTFKS